MDATDEPVPKRRLLTGRFGCPAPPLAMPDAPPRAVAADSPTAPTVMQMLPGMIFKSRQCARFAMPLTSRVESGSFGCFRKPGPTGIPGLPFHFAFPTVVDQCGDSHTAASFGFFGYLEFDTCGLAAAETGTTTFTPAPAFKLVGKNIYHAADSGSVVAEEYPRHVTAAALGSVWGDLELAKVALVVNSAAFFHTPRFDKAAVLASSADPKSFGVGGACVAISKTNIGVVSTAHAAPQRPRAHSPALSRYVIVLNPPADSGHGARVTSVSGGTLTARGTSTPLKLVLESADTARCTTKRVVTLWTSDATAIFGSPPNFHANAILLINGAPSLSNGGNGVELTVRAGVMAVDDTRMVPLVSDTIKSLLNGIAHDARICGGTTASYDPAIDGVLAEGRAVPIVAHRASSADVVLVKRAELLKLIRADVGNCVGDGASNADDVAIAKSIRNGTTDQLIEAVDAVDRALVSAGGFDHARETMVDEFDDDPASQRAIAVLSFFEGLDKAKAGALCVMVKRTSCAPADEVADDDDEDDEDLCKGI